MEAPIRAFAVATAFWGVAGFLTGVVIALQLAFPLLNLDLEWSTFGRLRPVHASAVIFAFGGNALICTSLHIVRRTCRARLFGGGEMGWFLFRGCRFSIVMAALGCVPGVTQGKEYAEPGWYADLWLTVVRVACLAAFAGTILKREEPHICMANWFLPAFIVAVAVLHLGGNLALPVSLGHARSYGAASGVQDAMIQWWYGHNAVGFFLTAGFLGMMYHFIPKQAERPVCFPAGCPSSTSGH